MALRLTNALGLKLLHELPAGLMAPQPVGGRLEFVRHIRKHWNPKWRLLRSVKVMKVELPNYHEKTDEMSPEEMRSKMKAAGMQPPRPWSEKQMFISSTGTTFEPYVPPEGDGRVSPISAQGAKQTMDLLSKKTKSMMAFRKIRAFEEDFDVPEFVQHATQIYIKAHECMAAHNTDDLIKYVTERVYPEALHNIDRKTLRWRYIKEVEYPRVVHARITDVITKENMFAQITVRFHSQQSLAVYDRFGRLMHGSEIIAKDVLEYVVFEKHISNEYGKWRIHEKIIPDWLPPREPAPRTFVKPEEPEAASAVETKDEEKTETAPTDASSRGKEAVAVA